TAAYTPALPDALPILRLVRRLALGRVELRAVEGLRALAGEHHRQGVVGFTELAPVREGQGEHAESAAAAAERKRGPGAVAVAERDRKSTRLNSSHVKI